MAVVVDLCKPNRKLQTCGFTTNHLTNQIKVMLLYYSVSLEQPYILSCASRNAHLTLASHQRISKWQKTNPGEKKVNSFCWVIVLVCVSKGPSSSSWSRSMKLLTGGADSPPRLALSHCICTIKPHPLFMNLASLPSEVWP